MHLPDGFLDTRTALLSAGVAAGGVGIALRQVRNTVEARRMPLLGLASAFVFAAQMLNFPVAGGTSGHLLGGVLTAILLGPSAAVLVLTCVLLVQCLMFADGGVMALGANVFNMAIVSVCGGYAAFWLSKRCIPMEQTRGMVFAAAFGGWFGTVLASITCAGQLALSQTAPWSIAFPAMANVHMLIGIGEGLATGLIILGVLRARPELVAGSSMPREAEAARRESWAGVVGYGLLLAVGLALFVAPFACGWPDGLEAAAKTLGLNIMTATPVIPAPLANYRIPWIGSATQATGMAGAIGTGLAFVAAYLLARMVVPGAAANERRPPGRATNPRENTPL
jgi:cobalt/nickel transport system permease protein